MSHYKHLNIKERESIWEMKIKGYSMREIAQEVKRSAGTVSRELRRNKGGKYWPSRAQKSMKNAERTVKELQNCQIRNCVKKYCIY